MKLIVLLAAILCCTPAFSQKRDTIYTYNKTIVCKIKEVADENVKYSYPDEDILVSINKNRIKKISYSSGRKEVFAENTDHQEVNGWEDWTKVVTTTIDDEVDGLFKLGDVSSKVKAGTALSNLNKIKNKALRKIKIRAAMIGANVIHLSSDHTEGHRYNAWTNSTNTAEVILTGVAYSNRTLNINEFKKVVERRNNFRLIEIVQMPYNKKSPTIVPGKMTPVNLKNYTVEGLHAFVEYKGDKFRVLSASLNQVVLMREGKRRTYNYILK